MTEPARPSGSDLCLSCGLCCTGVLYIDVSAEEHEVTRMRGAGMEVREDGERLLLQLPCNHFRDGGCGIYADRYTKCRSFRCALLKRVEAGEVEPAEASRIVAQAKASLEKLTAIDPQAKRARYRVERRRAGAPAADAGPEASRAWIESLAFDRFLDRFFRNKPMVR